MNSSGQEKKKGFTLNVVHAPPKIRALAKVIHDVDREQFEELFADDGTVDTGRVQDIVEEIDGTTLDDHDLQLFESAYVEYGQHLRGVDVSRTAKNKVGESLILTAAIDRECSLAGIALGNALDAVVESHNVFLKIVQFEVPTKHRKIFGIFCDRIKADLHDILQILKFRSDHRHEQMSQDHQSDLVRLNSRVWYEIEHFKWFIDIAQQAAFIDAHDHISDISAAAVWEKYVGQDCAACTTAEFEPALLLFPEWARNPILQALDFQSVGVVSIYTIQRLLMIWGPFLLLDRNLQRDVAGGIMNFTDSAETMRQLMEHRQNAEAAPTETEPVEGESPPEKTAVGDYVVTLSRGYGKLDVTFVTKMGLRNITTDRSTGAWVLHGLNREDFETVFDACSALPDLFKTPKGQTIEVPQETEKKQSVDAYSILHRACFRNNYGYVRSLIDRGGSILVNSAVADPSITPNYTWPPLLCAVNNPNGDPVEIAELLIEYGAEVEYYDEAQCTALYYCIVNGFHKTAAVLLKRCPWLQASRSSHPLLIAMGAHWFNPSDIDNRRCLDLIPSAKMIAVIVRLARNWEMVKTCLKLLEKKLVNVDMQRDECPVHWNFEQLHVPIRTDAELEFERRCIQHNTKLVREHAGSMTDVLRMLRMHAFYLSCQDHVVQIRSQSVSIERQRQEEGDGEEANQQHTENSEAAVAINGDMAEGSHVLDG